MCSLGCRLLCHRRLHQQRDRTRGEEDSVEDGELKEAFAKMVCRRVCTTSGKDKSVGKISPSGPDWVDDTNVTQCKSCGFVFSFIIRKHHCRMCGSVFCRYCAAETCPLPKFEYLSPVRVCRKCARLCWKAEALVQAIQANDVNSLIKYVQRKNDCNLHIAVFPPLTVAAGTSLSLAVCFLLVQTCKLCT